MTAEKGKTGVLLPLVLIGAVILSGVGLLGLLLEAADENEHDSIEFETDSEIENKELAAARSHAETRFEGSFEEAEAAKANAPEETVSDLKKGFRQPDLPALPEGDGPATRSSDDDLLSGGAYISEEESPGSPDVEMDETFSLLNGYDGVLREAYEGVRKEEIPSELPEVDIDEEIGIPVEEEGTDIENEDLGGIEEDLDSTHDDMNDLLEENTPDANSAGMDNADLSDSVWDISNSTERDSDGDGNPEWKYEVRVAYGSRNLTLRNGTQQYVIGYEYEYADDDSDGVPNLERMVRIRLANFTRNGKITAEGVSYSESLRNDTDGDGTIDRVEIRHLSYGYHSTVFGTVRSFAIAGELLMDDEDQDGDFENREGTKVFFFRKEVPNRNVILKESFIIAHGEQTGNKGQLSRISFNRVNNTSGKTVLEEAHIWTYSENDTHRNLVVIAGRTNTVIDREQYVVLNISESTVVDKTTTRITGFAVDNTTLILGGSRSDAVAVDLTETIKGDEKEQTGFIAASRTENRTGRLIEGFLVISVNRTLKGGNITDEEAMIITGRNVTTDGLNSTMAFAQRVMIDSDADGNPEYLKEAFAIGRSEDHDLDGNVDVETYAVHWTEMKDSEDDGSPEYNQTFSMLGRKVDFDDDGIIDRERGLMTNVTSIDSNSNGIVELKETGVIGFEKNDDDSDGTLDSERYAGFWEKIIDVHDDGTEINTQSGTWTHEE